MTNSTTHIQEIYECQTCGPVVLNIHGNCITCGSAQVVSTHTIDLGCEATLNDVTEPTITITKQTLHDFVHHCVDIVMLNNESYHHVIEHFFTERSQPK